MLKLGVMIDISTASSFWCGPTRAASVDGSGSATTGWRPCPGLPLPRRRFVRVTFVGGWASCVSAPTLHHQPARLCVVFWWTTHVQDRCLLVGGCDHVRW